MSTFEPSNPSLLSFIENNRSFSLELVQGINGQKKQLTKDLIEAHDQERTMQIENYLKHFKLQNGELASLLSDNSKIDNTHKGWLRKCLATHVNNNDSLDDKVKNQIIFGIIPLREGVDLEKQKLDFKLVNDDPLLKVAFKTKSASIHYEALLIITKEIDEIAQHQADIENSSNTPRADKIATLLSVTGESSLAELVVKIRSEAEVSIDISEEVKSHIIRNLEGIMTDKDTVTEMQKLIGVEKLKITMGSEDSISELNGSINSKLTSNTHNLNYTQHTDLALIAKRIVQSSGINIDTEFSKLGFLRRNPEVFIDKETRKKTEKSGLSKALSKIPFMKNNEDKGKITNWESEDYSWHKKDKHFDTESKGEIKKITFKDSKGILIFTHNPNSLFGNKGGNILFAKGRTINKEEATLMVAQFLRTNTTSKMFITPPKLLNSIEETKTHVELIVTAALDMGVDVNSISIRPNGVISNKDINEILEKAMHDFDNKNIDEFGGLTGVQNKVTNEMDSILEVENNVFQEKNTANKSIKKTNQNNEEKIEQSTDSETPPLQKNSHPKF